MKIEKIYKSIIAFWQIHMNFNIANPYTAWQVKNQKEKQLTLQIDISIVYFYRQEESDDRSNYQGAGLCAK